MKLSGPGRVAAGMRAAAPAFLAAIVVLLLLRFPPGESSFYPRCPVYELLHLRCPGCGATRALAELLRGHVTEAWHQNALFLIASPMCLAYAVRSYGDWMSGEELRWARPSRALLVGAFTVAAVFMALRNVWQFGI